MFNFTTIQGIGHSLKGILAGKLRLAGVDSSNHRRSLPIAVFPVHRGIFLSRQNSEVLLCFLVCVDDEMECSVLDHFAVNLIYSRPTALGAASTP